MKKRLDILLVEQGYFDTRTKAQSNIMAGNVLVNDEPVFKSGTKINIQSNIRIKKKLEYVSRGALKLKFALEKFNLNINNKICADIGSSTGGFTDILLKNNAKLVYAIDVGTNQLDYSLRINKKVIVKEKTNARYLKKVDFTFLPDIITIDVSFISLTLLLKNLIDILKTDGDIIALIKPQFEIGKQIKNFNGVVKDKKFHIKTLINIKKFLELNKLPTKILNYTFSPIKGPKGNIEFFIHLKKDTYEFNNNFNEEFFDSLIKEAASEIY